MRLAAQMKGGFYPAHNEAVAYAAIFLRPPDRQPFAILDPCAGEGAAIQRLAELLGSPVDRTFAIELEGRILHVMTTPRGLQRISFVDHNDNQANRPAASTMAIRHTMSQGLRSCC